MIYAIGPSGILSRRAEELKELWVKPQAPVQEVLRAAGTTPLVQGETLYQLLKRPELGYGDIQAILAGLGREDAFPYPRELEVVVKYAEYIERERRQVERFRQLEELLIPLDLDYGKVPALSREATEKLSRYGLGPWVRPVGSVVCRWQILIP